MATRSIASLASASATELRARGTWAAARTTLAGFDRWSAAHVPRALNSVADALANEAIDRVALGGPASVVRRPPV